MLIQEGVGVPVSLITWGHPNMNSEWREHQLNVYAEDFLWVGFYFDFKQTALQELADINMAKFTNQIKGYPGARRIGLKKPKVKEEKNAEKLPIELVGKHCNSYWEICRKLGCPRRPQPKIQMNLISEDKS
jgi:hypothetical protein